MAADFTPTQTYLFESGLESQHDPKLFSTSIKTPRNMHAEQKLPRVMRRNKKVSPPWSDLPEELIGLILGHLSFADHVRFGAACTLWRSVATRTRHHRALELPWMICSVNDSLDRNIFLASSLGDDKVHRLYNMPILSQFRCLGSKSGWMAMADTVWGYHLLNPFTGSQIRLPDHAKTVEGRKPVPISPRYFRKAVLSAIPTKQNVLSRTCAVAALRNNGDGIAIYRPGFDDVWLLSPYTSDANEKLVDIIFYEGMLYALTNNLHVVIYSFSSARSWPAKIARVYRPEIPERHSIKSRNMFLVGGHGGGLFFAFRYGDDNVDNCVSNVRFKIYELGQEGTRWVEVNCLDDIMLFVGDSCSKSYIAAADGSSGYSGDCVYFSNDELYPDFDSFYRGDDEQVLDESPFLTFCLDNKTSRPLTELNDQDLICEQFWFVLMD